jgi:hypothetical protein
VSRYDAKEIRELMNDFISQQLGKEGVTAYTPYRFFTIVLEVGMILAAIFSFFHKHLGFPLTWDEKVRVLMVVVVFHLVSLFVLTRLRPQHLVFLDLLHGRGPGITRRIVLSTTVDPRAGDLVITYGWEGHSSSVARRSLGELFFASGTLRIPVATKWVEDTVCKLLSTNKAHSD